MRKASRDESREIETVKLPSGRGLVRRDVLVGCVSLECLGTRRSTTFGCPELRAHFRFWEHFSCGETIECVGEDNRKDSSQEIDIYHGLGQKILERKNGETGTTKKSRSPF